MSSFNPDTWEYFEHLIKQEIGNNNYPEKKGEKLVMLRLKYFYLRLMDMITLPDLENSIDQQNEAKKKRDIVIETKEKLKEPIDLTEPICALIWSKESQTFIRFENGLLRVDYLKFHEKEDMRTDFYYYDTLAPLFKRRNSFNSLSELVQSDAFKKIEPDVTFSTFIVTDLMYRIQSVQIKKNEKNMDEEILYYEELEKKSKCTPYKSELCDIETALERHNAIVDEYLLLRGETRKRKIV